MTRAPRFVAFDLGGVLAEVDHGALARHLLASPEAIDEAFFSGDAHRRLTLGRLSPTPFLRRASSALALPLSSVDAAWRSMVRLAPGAVGLVEEVAAVAPVAAWSNTDPLHWEVLAAKLPFPFTDPDRRCLSFEVGAKKPDPAFFRAGLARLGAEPAHLLYVDDREDHLAAAAALGVRAERAEGVDEARAVVRRRLGL